MQNRNNSKLISIDRILATMSLSPSRFKLFFWMICRAKTQDDGDLKRGQLRATVWEMQEVGSHRVGYRKIKPSANDIHRICRNFRQDKMITTTRDRDGIIITILDYDLIDLTPSVQ